MWGGELGWVGMREGAGFEKGCEDVGMGTAYEYPGRAIRTVLLVVQRREAESVEGFGDGVVFVAVLLP